jgi:hypothetical protein
MKKSKQTKTEEIKSSLPKLHSKGKRASLKQENDKLNLISRKGLAVIETLYMTNPEIFRLATIEAYSDMVSELNSIGGQYAGQQEMIDMATNQLLMKAKKPMQKAGKNKKATETETKKAI